jgi:hypothetical protein
MVSTPMDFTDRASTPELVLAAEWIIEHHNALRLDGILG